MIFLIKSRALYYLKHLLHIILAPFQIFFLYFDDSQFQIALIEIFFFSNFRESLMFKWLKLSFSSLLSWGRGMMNSSILILQNERWWGMWECEINFLFLELRWDIDLTLIFIFWERTCDIVLAHILVIINSWYFVDLWLNCLLYFAVIREMLLVWEGC